MAVDKYDLIVIGSGPAGEKGAAQAAYFGKKVAIIEKEKYYGGAAANTGTLPSKTLRETSLTLSGFKARKLHGVDLSLKGKLTVNELMYHENHVVNTERTRVDKNIFRHSIVSYFGNASFIDNHTIKVERKEIDDVILQSDFFLIATGSSPRKTELFPHEHPSVYDSDSILHLEKMPEKLIVVGAGVIGSEYACTFSALEVEVSLIDSKDILLPFLDREISISLKERMKKLGIKMFTPDKVESCNVDNKLLNIKLSSGTEIKSDAVLVTAGRISNTSSLNLEAAGIIPGKYGLIDTNQFFQTSEPHIYAAGDVIGFPALASTSMEQARLAMVHAFDLKYKKEVAPILPYGIYTIPEVSMAGETEESLTQKGIKYIIGKAGYGQNARGIIIGDEEGFLKLIFKEDNMQLLGVHIIGEIASELIHIGLNAILMNATAELFIRTCFNYPTLSELYKYATYDALGNKFKKSHK